MAFFGADTVRADLRLHRQQAGLVTAGTLNVQTGGTVAYANVCLWPENDVSALGGGGMPFVGSMVTAWRVGEADPAPRPDDTWTVGGTDYLISSVRKRHNHDEASGYAIYDCQVSRAA